MVRDPGFSQGRGIGFLVKNTGRESNRLFILWHLIFEEIKRYTNDVKYHLTNGFDMINSQALPISSPVTPSYATCSLALRYPPALILFSTIMGRSGQ